MGPSSLEDHGEQEGCDEGQGGAEQRHCTSGAHNLAHLFLLTLQEQEKGGAQYGLWVLHIDHR